MGTGPLLFMFCVLSCYSAQAEEIPGDITFFGLEQRVAYLKRICVSIKVPMGSDTAFGSGFLVNTQKYISAVTCNHCVPRDTAIVSVNVEGGKREEVIATVLARSPGKDAAVLFLDMPKKRPDVMTVGLSSFDSTDTDHSLLREGAGVVILGFPLMKGLSEPELGSLAPVCRIGIVAYHSLGSIKFLIDGFASHGNSGSPVLSSKRDLLLGMISAFEPDRINLYDETGKTAASLPYNSGLAEATTAKAISDLIKLADVKADELIKKLSGQQKKPSK
jgi:hypothetical protein